MEPAAIVSEIRKESALVKKDSSIRKPENGIDFHAAAQEFYQRKDTRINLRDANAASGISDSPLLVEYLIFYVVRLMMLKNADIGPFPAPPRTLQFAK